MGETMIEVRVPELSESVSGGTLLAWRKAVGDAVARDEILVDLETDKVVLEITAPVAGLLSEILVAEGGEVQVGQVIAHLEAANKADLTGQTAKPAAKGVAPAPLVETKAAPVSAPRAVPEVAPEVVSKVNPTASPTASPAAESSPAQPPEAAFLSPSQRRHGVTVAQPAPAQPAAASQSVASQSVASQSVAPSGATARNERRVPMTRLRQRIAERLKEAQNTAALLTTFNEVNMGPLQAVRQRYKDSFQQEHGVKLGLTSFFVRAVCHALKQYPVINARVTGRDILYHDYCDIGMAVSSERGLVVPILRDAETLSLAAIERRIADFARRANALQLQIEELEGGTFTITNGGIFGSLMSTPILNPPQSAVLGLHKIQDRPIAENGQVVIRPMMYLALSYDHRIIDGREAVSFLASVKEGIEDPTRLLLDL